jgi:hypothetical protein
MTDVDPIRAKAESCLPDYRLSRVLGSGVYGSVFEACRIPQGPQSLSKTVDSSKICSGTSGGYAVKVIAVKDSLNLISAILDATALTELQGKTWINSRGQTKALVPKVYFSGRCGTTSIGQDAIYTIVMDEYQTDGFKIGAVQYAAAAASRFPRSADKPRLLYTSKQFDDFFRIAATMDAMGFIHGDLTARQYLLRPAAAAAGPTSDWDMVISDFGLPRTWGWSYNYGCPTPIDDVITASGVNLLDAGIADYFNQWQLAASFVTHFTTFVEDPITGKYLLFQGLTGLPDWWTAMLTDRCPILLKIPGTSVDTDALRQQSIIRTSEAKRNEILRDWALSGIFKVIVPPMNKPSRLSAVATADPRRFAPQDLAKMITFEKLRNAATSASDPTKADAFRNDVVSYLAIR